MIVVPSAVVYRPFTYLWTLAVGRFPEALRQRPTREIAVREIARCFLAGAGTTAARRAGARDWLSRPEAGRGNQALVAEGYAISSAAGVYSLAGRGSILERATGTPPQR